MMLKIRETPLSSRHQIDKVISARRYPMRGSTSWAVILISLTIMIACNPGNLARPNTMTATAAEGGTINSTPTTIFLPLVTKAPCTTYSASLTFQANKSVYQVGEAITVTATLLNSGCSKIGLPYYQVQPQTLEHVTPSNPSGIQSYVALDPGGSDSVVFLFTASSAGETSFSARSDFEVSLESGPGLLGTAFSSPITITINTP